MTDKEKVIKGLESQLDDLQKYADADEVVTLTQEQAKDICALLKEQESEILKYIDGVAKLVMENERLKEKICSVKELAMDEAKNATWREDAEAWEVLDRIVQKLS